jgi:hypothetical protein
MLLLVVDPRPIEARAVAIGAALSAPTPQRQLRRSGARGCADGVDCDKHTIGSWAPDPQRDPRSGPEFALSLILLSRAREIRPMMGERRVMQEALLYGFSLERHVPDNHLPPMTPELVIARWACQVRRNSAARRSRTFATSEVPIGVGGWEGEIVALSPPRRFANTSTPSRARPCCGLRSARNGRCLLSPAYGRPGAASEGQRGRRLITRMSCSVSSRPTPTPS